MFGRKFGSVKTPADAEEVARIARQRASLDFDYSETYWSGETVKFHDRAAGKFVCSGQGCSLCAEGAEDFGTLDSRPAWKR